MKPMELLLPLGVVNHMNPSGEQVPGESPFNFGQVLEKNQLLVDEQLLDKSVNEDLQVGLAEIEILDETEDMEKAEIEDLLKELQGLVDTETNPEDELNPALTEVQLPVEAAQSNTAIAVLLKEIHVIMSQVLDKNTESSNQVSKQILKLLEQWSSLKQQSGEATMQKALTDGLSKEERAIWEQLSTRFDKRQYFSGQKMYQENAHVTKGDIVNWLQNALQRLADADEAMKVETVPKHTDTEMTISQTTMPTVPVNGEATGVASKDTGIIAPKADTQLNIPLPMSKTEQYTIYVQNTEKVDQISHALAEKLTTVLNQSQFLKAGTEQMQLSIMLKPENLGNMTIRFMQVDGEMLVKILVTSQAAKEMLETNMHQLKSVFSPHQIMIERDDQVLDKDFFEEEESQDGQTEDEHLKDSEHESQEQGSQENLTEIDFDTLFQALREEGTA